MDARLQAAAWLARAHDAHLVGSAATGMSWPAYALLTGSMAVTPIDEFESLREAGRTGLARFAERARQLGVQTVEQGWSRTTTATRCCCSRATPTCW